MTPDDPRTAQIAGMILFFWIALCMTIVAYYFTVWIRGAV